MALLTEFHGFPDLPTELRLKIFSIALSSPRVVNITCNRGPYQHQIRQAAKCFTSNHKPPALLHVCHESRQEGLSVYAPSFKTDVSPIYTYISFSQDTIRMSDGALSYLRDDELKSIRKMILDVQDAVYFTHFNIDILQQMQPNLKEVELVAAQGEVYSWIGGDIQALSREIKIAIEANPDWESPYFKIVECGTGDLVEIIEPARVAP